MTSSAIPARIANLRQLMERSGVQAYLVPTADAHNSEYVPPCWQRRAWISGFTGSAGHAFVDLSKAWLWTDGRYFLQAETQLAGTGFELVRMGAPGTPEFTDWLSTNLKPGQAVGVDPRTITLEQERKYKTALEKAGARLELLDQNLIDALWSDRPAPSSDPILALDMAFTGETSSSKLDRVRKALEKDACDSHVVSMLDAIAWLFNLRGSDVEYNPLFIAHAVIERDAATLFVDATKLDASARASIPSGVTLSPYEGLASTADTLGASGHRVLLDPATSSPWIADRLRKAGAKIHEARSPITIMKSCKNAVEIAGARAAHVRDGVAMTRFLAWLGANWGEGRLTEISAADQLEKYRSEGEHFRGLSFPSISGMGPHGAIIHYRPEASTDIPLVPGIYLIDSGAQYSDGTTDITRTVAFGPPTPEQRDRFTRVLRGHIALARQVFPVSTTGKHLDALARLPLWDIGLNYTHGTGHGVGAYLCVHEGPQGISTKAADVPLEPGMICSNEPGYYEPGAYGIRIENLVVVTERPELSAGPEKFLGFDTVTCCPIDTSLVEASLLLPAERQWLNDHHAWVRTTLSPLVDATTQGWLARATAAI